MKRTNVDSSMLRSIGYDKKKKILEVQFDHGGIYQYFDVPKEEFDDLMNASSHGRYFRSNIIDCYDYLEV